MKIPTNMMRLTYIRRTILWLLLIIGVTVPGTTLAATGSVEQWLDSLDASLARRNEYEQQRLQRIDVLKEQLNAQGALPSDQRFMLNYSLYNEYKVYCYDSARHYANACMELARQSGNQNYRILAQDAIAFSLISAGILSEASAQLAATERQALSGEQLTSYYERNVQLWRSMADYVKEEPFYTKYISQSNAYLDSLRAITPENSLQWWSYTGSLQMRAHQYQQALESFNHVMSLNDNDRRLTAVTMAEMAWAYIYLDNEEKAIECFAQSAIADNETATREITALYHLSRLVYKRGDYERASRYVHQALEDVNFYNTRLRKVEINDILPIIEQDRYDAMRSQRNWLFLATGLAVALLLAMVGSYWFIRKKNRKLTEARQTIANQLEELSTTNQHLKEADKIKNAYIGRSFYTNAEFVEKLEKLFLSLDRKIATRQYDDLRSTLKQSTLSTERENMYAAFDETFLKLFPQFVKKYNDLFEEKDRRQPATETSLTSEMRIFALIRLGITDSERIAKFLDYSVHTVNTYKTRIKNRSVVDNDQFEQLIMAI